MSAPTFKIRRLTVDYRVPSDHPSPWELRRRLDEVAGKELPLALRTLLQPDSNSSGDESVWFIRRLEIDCRLNAAWGRDRLASSWAVPLVRRLIRIIETGGDGVQVVRFENRAAHLATFLDDLAGGNAWSKWYHRGFVGLKALPVSAALRTAVLEEPARGLQALRSVDEPGTVRLIQVLTESDAKRILRVFGGEPPAAADWAGLRSISKTWTVLEGSGPCFSGESRSALHLFLTAMRSAGGAEPGPRAAAALTWVRMARGFAGLSYEDQHLLTAALIAGDPSPTIEFLRGLGATPFASPEAPPPARLGPILESLIREPATSAARARGSVATTRLGGVFLLLPLLDELPLEEATHAWPLADGLESAAIARYWILLKCLGLAPKPPGALDPLPVELAGLSPPSTEAIRLWSRKVRRSHLERFLRTVAAWRRTRGEIEAKKLALVPGRLPGTPAFLLTDAQTGFWLKVPARPHRRPGALEEELLDWLNPIPAGGALTAPRELVGRLARLFPHIQVIDDASDRRDRRNRQVAGELAGMKLHADWRIRRPLDLALSVAAQGLMRSFARSLPGFAGSGLEHLRQNFLRFDAVIEEQASRRLVRLGRPPLNLILNMAGLTRRTYTLRWLDDRPFELFQAYGD